MRYDPETIRPMREELTSLGIEELLTANDVTTFLAPETGTAMVVLNSVCGCSADAARPAVRLAMNHSHRPDRVGTVFAGQDVEATDKARSYFGPIPPSSPSIALFKDGNLVHFVPREVIQAGDSRTVAKNLVTAFDEHCR